MTTLQRLALALCLALPLLAQIPAGSNQLSSVSGNGHTVVTTTGPQVSGHGVQIDANGNHVDSGSPIAGGSVPSQLVDYRAGVCQGTTASIGTSLQTANTPTAVCFTDGSNTTLGVAEFTATGQALQDHFKLPSDWTLGIDFDVSFRSVGTTGNVVWALQTACVANGVVIAGTTWNTKQTLSTASQGTTLQLSSAALTSITVTGCGTNGMFFWNLTLDSSTTESGNVDLIELRFKVRRLS